MADWAQIGASALGFVKITSTTLLQILQANNQLLESIQDQVLGHDPRTARKREAS